MTMLASYDLFGGELPPTVIMSLWHGGFSATRNPFATCYYSYPSLGVSEEVRKKATISENCVSGKCEKYRQRGRVTVCAHR